MALLDNTDQSQQSPGLLGNVPGGFGGVLMAALSGGMRRRNASMGGGGVDPMAMMAAQQMQRENLIKFQMALGDYQLKMNQAQRAADLAQQQMDLRNQAGQAVLDYKPPVGQMPYVQPEYDTITANGVVPANQMPSPSSPQLSMPSAKNLTQQAVQNQIGGMSQLPQELTKVPSENYINNIAQAGEEAKKNAPPGPIVADPLLRQLAAGLLKSSDPKDHTLAWTILNGGGPFSIGDTRYTGTGQPVVTNPDEKNLRLLPAMNTLRDDYNKQTEPFAQAGEAYDRINTVRDIPYNKQTAINHVNVLYNMMKMISPNMRVNQGTQATAEQTPGIPDQLLKAYNKAVNNKIIPENEMQGFYNQADSLYKASRDDYMNTRNQYIDIAKRNGINPQDVTPDREVPGRFRGNQDNNASNALTVQQATQKGMVRIQIPDGRVGFFPANKLGNILKIPGVKRI